MKKVGSKFRPGNWQLLVKRSATGRGLFAGEALPRGACLTEYVGRRVSKEEAEYGRGKYLFDVGKGITLDGNVKYNIARYINHSCKPNCEADGPPGRVFITTLRAIKPGEELFYDYGEEYFDMHLSRGRCRCKKHIGGTMQK